MMENKARYNFRLIDYSSHSGSMNMAIDEAILSSYASSECQPTLRFYGWEPPALSIGYGQKLSEKLTGNCKELGLDIVRRPTGGRAVLHQNEFTYSFICGAASSDLNSAILGESIIEAYKQICQGLINGFSILGLEVSLGSSEKSYRDFDDCFMATTTADLHIAGKKIVGSAQLRRGKAVLQHGSIVLNQDHELMSKIFGAKLVDSGKTRHANLFHELGKTIETKELVEAFQRGFSQAFDCDFAKTGLTNRELEKAETLHEKFLVSSSVRG